MRQKTEVVRYFIFLDTFLSRLFTKFFNYRDYYIREKFHVLKASNNERIESTSACT